jgi:succinate-acetate transporter protein
MKKMLSLEKGKRKAKLGIVFMVLSFSTIITAVALDATAGELGALATCVLTTAAGLASVMASNAKEHQHSTDLAIAAKEIKK